MALYFRLKYGEKIKTFSPIIRPYRARVATYVLTIIPDYHNCPHQLVANPID